MIVIRKGVWEIRGDIKVEQLTQADLDRQRLAIGTHRDGMIDHGDRWKGMGIGREHPPFAQP